MTFPLSACGDPRESEIRAAIEHEFKAASGLVRAFGGGSQPLLTPKVTKLEKHQCREDTNRLGYICQVTMEVEMPLVGKQSGTRELRVTKTNDGWRLVN